jgi:hypothetical protein
MTLEQFQLLDEARQAETIWEGSFIADREDEGYKILLYQVDAFYVEVFYDKASNAIQRHFAFSSTDLLEPYLEKIKILL